MSSSLVELLQMQVDRLEMELKRKQGEVERAEKRADESAQTATRAAETASVVSEASSKPLGADGPLRVELAKLTASVKNMTESEERHKARIQQLLKSLAEEREGKEDAIRQAEMKQSTIDMCSTEMDRLETEKKELIEQLDVKQTSVELLSTQEESLQTLCEATEARLAELQAASDAQRSVKKGKCCGV
jgi:chromosome segregation ATPase